MKTSETITELAKALSQFQKAVEQPTKSANNPFFKSKYVPLENVITTIKKHASPLGLGYVQVPVSEENKIGVKTILTHDSGEFIEFDAFLLPLDKNTAQGAGSALTYARRYSLSAAFGIASDEDDDGNEASGNDEKKQSTKSTKPTTSKRKQEDPLATSGDVEVLKSKSHELEQIFGKTQKEVWASYGINQKEDLTKKKVMRAINSIQNELNKVNQEQEKQEELPF
ncbi:ERF family protein [Listeria aquatica]|uniref:ERF family protein n=1 Tax=Listeria aquatica TaxID=1494960 RepID=A0A841ZM99_9LIST|nr:ERF family protein [Listeria aquatica]MBC1521426.1 ERF family protein [Listeria aquatica]